MQEDKSVVERARAGDRAAFETLVRTHRARVFGIVRRYLKNDADAEDVTQRVFVRAFEGLDGFRNESSFATWVCRIGINLALNHLRGGIGPGDERVPLEDDLVFTNGLGTAKLVAAELWQKVCARIDELPVKQRLVVELRAFHDLSFDEIATVAGCSEESAKANYHHAVKRLRAALPSASD